MTYLSSTLALLCDRQSLSSFIQLRGKKVSAEPLSSQPNSFSEKIAHNTIAQTGLSAQAQNQDLLSQADRSAPLDLLAEMRAFTTPNNWKPSSAEHTYLVSLDFIQQRGLVRALESCSAVRLVERDSVTPSNPALSSDPSKQSSVDISLIVGLHSAVVFFPLAALPTHTACTALFMALSAYSWRFSSILLVLLDFPRKQLLRAPNPDNDTQNQELEGPCAYGPPVLKAARRIRRDLALRDGTNEKRAECAVELAFADGVGEAAMFVREFSELALKESVVDYAPYIGEDEPEGERDLADVEGMNAFCAAIILRCCTVGEFLDMMPEQRAEGFADLIGKERIEHVNAVLSERMQAMDTSLPSSSDFLSSLDE
ncbi:hypothetical protein DFH11DRAFT_1789389 [Phellopilus nigrolimitatus]|nr:hypothetical protein DFH11DRAFT_1789389 [Phellopilus nigrolimitatus]